MNQGPNIRRYKLFVKTSPNCIQILKFILANIDAINAAGIKISIEKIKRSDMDDEMVAILNKYHITRLPALRSEDGKVAVGINDIIAILKRTSKASSAQSNVQSMLPSTGDPVGDFFAKELYTVDKTGKAEPRKDQEEDDRLDMSKKITQAGMSHRGGIPGPSTKRHQAFMDKNTQEEDYDIPHQPMARQQQTPDNIDEIHRSENRGGDPDDVMMKHWMDNNIEGRY